jgi:hypothetical protein
MYRSRSVRRRFNLVALATIALQAAAQTPAVQQPAPAPVNPTYAASEADRQRMMDLLGIPTLREVLA